MLNHETATLDRLVKLRFNLTFLQSLHLGQSRLLNRSLNNVGVGEGLHGIELSLDEPQLEGQRSPTAGHCGDDLHIRVYISPPSSSDKVHDTNSIKMSSQCFLVQDMVYIYEQSLVAKHLHAMPCPYSASILNLLLSTLTTVKISPVNQT